MCYLIDIRLFVTLGRVEKTNFQNFILNVINMEGTTLNWLRSHPIRWFEYIFIPKLN